MRTAAIGALRHLVRLQTQTATPAPGGEADITWVDMASVWASIGAVSGREPVVADGLAGRTFYDVTIRYRPDVDARMRFEHGGRHLHIVSAFDPDGRRRWLVCRCEERGA